MTPAKIKTIVTSVIGVITAVGGLAATLAGIDSKRAHLWVMVATGCASVAAALGNVGSWLATRHTDQTAAGEGAQAPGA